MFKIEAKIPNSRARAGIIETAHGKIETPAFIPVATKATLKSLTPELVRGAVGAQAILANTYHLYLQPGTAILEKAGGLGKFMNWPGPTFTDSGGFQAFSLAGSIQERKSKIAGKKSIVEGISNDQKFAADRDEKIPLAVVNEEGVSFRSIIDGSSHFFTPERSIEIQHSIGADIIFAFDECLLPEESLDRQKAAVERTTRWAKRCLIAHNSFSRSPGSVGSALFGIVQGGRHQDLRRLSARQIADLDFEGFGIGGSFDKEDIGTAVGWVNDELPEDRPRHLLGIGSELADLVLGIENGVDTFDCVAPARIARNGAAYVGRGRINLCNAEFVRDFSSVDPDCHCYTCVHYTRAYLSHLFRAKEMLAAVLTTIHNLYFVVNLVKKARQAILENNFSKFKSLLVGSQMGF